MLRKIYNEMPNEKLKYFVPKMSKWNILGHRGGGVAKIIQSIWTKFIDHLSQPKSTAFGE